MLAGQDVLIERRLAGLPSIRAFAISGKIDFCSRGQSGVEIVDWKMGKSGGDEDSLQLALYGIWACKQFSVSPEKVRIRRVFLGDGKIEQARKLGERLMSRAQARLSQDVEEMAFLHPYGVAGHVEAFTPKPKEKVCEMCIFQKLCPASACTKR
jgi:PD-(D/E)XK nuclease superfamily